MSNKQLLYIFLIPLLVILSANPAQGQQTGDNVGVGVMVGEPTGLSLKLWTSSTTAFDAGLAWSLEGHEAIHIHADYLWHNFDIFSDDIDPGQLAFYYGIGGRLVFIDEEPDAIDEDDDDAVLGARVPLGLNYLFEDSPFDLFLEIAPIINLIPATDVDIDAAVGLRFYF